MKTIIVNAGPRKNWNTSKLLKAAKEGSEAAGMETEYVELYDFVFTGCRSCMVCKRKGLENPCKCFWKDMLSPVIESVYNSDRLLIGSPIYFSEPTGMFRNFLERVCFPPLSYNDYSSTYSGKVNVGVFLTMNINEELYNKNYKPGLETYMQPFNFLNGKTELFPSYDTLQVSDYSKYEMASFDEGHKKEVNKTTFQKDLEKAFEIGKKWGITD